jgi:hypothetical protein
MLVSIYQGRRAKERGRWNEDKERNKVRRGAYKGLALRLLSHQSHLSKSQQPPWDGPVQVKAPEMERNLWFRGRGVG